MSYTNGLANITLPNSPGYSTISTVAPFYLPPPVQPVPLSPVAGVVNAPGVRQPLRQPRSNMRTHPPLTEAQMAAIRGEVQDVNRFYDVANILAGVPNALEEPQQADCPNYQCIADNENRLDWSNLEACLKFGVCGVPKYRTEQSFWQRLTGQPGAQVFNGMNYSNPHFPTDFIGHRVGRRPVYLTLGQYSFDGVNWINRPQNVSVARNFALVMRTDNLIRRARAFYDAPILPGPRPMEPLRPGG